MWNNYVNINVYNNNKIIDINDFYINFYAIYELIYSHCILIIAQLAHLS